MKNCFILCYLQEKRASGSKNYFTATEILNAKKKPSSGAVFRKLNVYVAKSNFLESKIVNRNNHFVRAYRMTEETFKEW